MILQGANQREKFAMKLSLGSTAMAMTLALGVYLSDSAGAQQLQFACDQDGDAFVDASESRLCADAQFDKLAAGQALTAEQLGSIGQQRIPPSEVDQNDDGEISREEWIGYIDGRFTRAAAASGGKMSLEDYAKWQLELQP
jgi:hypothetical protein